MRDGPISGIYTCEVTTEPSFKVVTEQKELKLLKSEFY